VLGEQAQEETAVTVGPVHHRCNRKFTIHKTLILKACSVVLCYSSCTFQGQK
jgi:hypothetical protein